ncbi:MAG: hypothetical protein LUD47_07230 [Clostridia bacterium]|nr:hypothetical protein [Clostridia bacterium]
MKKSKKIISIFAVAFMAVFAFACIFGVACDSATTVESVPKFGESSTKHEHTYESTFVDGEWKTVCTGCGDELEEGMEGSADITYVVSDEEQIAAVLELGDSIKLGVDLEVAKSLEISSGDVTLDLGGNSLTSETAEKDSATVSVEKGATLTVTGEGTIENAYDGGGSTDNAAAIYTEGTVIVKSGTIESNSIGIKAENGATVTIEDGAIDSDYFALWLGGDGTTVNVEGGDIHGENKGIVLCGDGNYGHSDYQTGAVQMLNVYDGNLSCTNDSVICTLGTTNQESSVINIYGGTLTGADVYEGTTGKPFPTIYIANGTLNVYGGAIIGSTPLEVRGGTTVIYDGTFECTATGSPSHAYNSSGATSYGYALSVFPYTSTVKVGTEIADNTVSVTVCDGTFIGELYMAVSEDYSSVGRNMPDFTFAIAGGLFTADPGAYLAEGYKAVSDEDSGYYVVTEVPGVTE